MGCSPPAPLSMGLPRQEYWSGLPFLSPRDLPDPGIEPRSPAFQADALTAEPPLNSENRHIWDCCSYRHACMLSRFSHVWLWPYGLWPTRLLIPWDSPGKKTGVGFHALLQGIFPTQESNSSVSPAVQVDSLPLSHWASPAIGADGVKEEKEWQAEGKDLGITGI